MEPKPWWQSKTFWAGVSAIVAGVAMWVQGLGIETLLTSATGMLMIILRIVTKQPLE